MAYNFRTCLNIRLVLFRSVSAGDQIGFTITLTNSGAGIARNVTGNDTLPSNPGTSWSIDAAHSDSGWSITAGALGYGPHDLRSEDHTSELQSRPHLVCRFRLD